MPERYAIVVTTINPPTRGMVELAGGAGRLGADVIVIGDEKSPKEFALDGADFLDIEAQRRTGFSYAAAVPARHYARKNVGYLVAAARGADVIIETDDDNIPLDGFWGPRSARVRAPVLRRAGWVNVYRYFSEALIWPRGLPLDEVRTQGPARSALPETEMLCPIQQGLANRNPDVDAIYRLVLPLPVDFDDRPPVVLADGSWCPFNSQNTTWWREAFPLLYLPFHCSFRMTDIWRSLVAQRIAWLNGWAVAFHAATMFQERNEHSLMRDFEDEIPGYLRNNDIRAALDELPLNCGTEAIPENLRLSYRRLIEINCVGPEEMVLLDAWLADLERISS